MTNGLKPFTSATAPRNGRPMNARNRLGFRFVEALRAEFEEHGEAAIRIVRTERPAEFLKIVAAVLPAQLDFNNGVVICRWIGEDEEVEDYPTLTHE